MIVRSSVVDPLFSALFAENIQILFNTIYVDGWIRIVSDKPENLKVLLEMRDIWKLITKNLISSHVTIPMKESIQACLNEFTSIWDSQRSIEIK